MKILVTGAAGQVGQSLVQQGSMAGYNMLGYDRQQLDISDRESVLTVLKTAAPDLVINAAAYTAVDRAEIESCYAYAINEQGPAFLARTCEEMDIPLFHISTDYVFAGDKQGAYDEEDTVRPSGVYGASKEAGERAVRKATDRHIILRTSWVFSPQGRCFPNTILRLAAERTELSVVNDQWGGPTSARAIADVLLKIAACYQSQDTVDSFPWGTYHFSQLPHLSWYGFAARLLDFAKAEGLVSEGFRLHACTTEDYPTAVSRPANSTLASDKLLQAFSIAPSNWEDDLQKLIEHQRHQFGA
ncbi:dTDP-4-dehydrorhamnose reductase [Neptuniibacter sp. CAU 1671]|uniref:dTDP-4-dehydrorhamnose reductase n=1 Tax=Neptuniibacter sp. CAU 1671 TaxID=3032593 RepID=UPI0023DB4CEF|nr:dTDP-4-dehydrorhamnose reductase [Neptuniibacter sp. CAU 1671]MDF2181416.1 dTDP-4-dehydrorhamnose reductase [Neptuniibacter sp. CAU 1671]